MADIFDKLQPIVERYRAIETEMAQPEVAADYARLGELNRERSGLEDLVGIDVQHHSLAEEQADLRALITEGGDPELVEMAQLELEDVETRLSDLAQRLRIALLAQGSQRQARRNRRDPRRPQVVRKPRCSHPISTACTSATPRNRAGTSIFWTPTRPTWADSAASRFSVDGRNAFSKLKFEAGVHRVQRVPETEAQGRIHTSTATVAVLPQADEVEVNIKEDDLRIDIFHAGGHGGQNVNKVATAVRIVHEPTGITVVCQDERSQYKNKSKAMTILRSRLYSAEQERHQAEISSNRKAQIGSGDRSEKIRTYNYPQDRITDHRISLSIHGMQRLMDGGLNDIIDRLIADDQERGLAAISA